MHKKLFVLFLLILACSNEVEFRFDPILGSIQNKNVIYTKIFSYVVNDTIPNDLHSPPNP